MNDNVLWTEAYRPSTIEECILPLDLKNTFQEFVNKKFVPNLILSGGPGVGKTTVARAMLEQLECDYIVINGSLNGDIDTLRVCIQNYASTLSIMGGRKYVILDEADYLNYKTQPALRNFMEEFSKSCGFILSCNFKNKIIEPLHSRCAVIDFIIPKKEHAKLASQFFKRACSILDLEKIEYDKAVIAEVIKKYFPDWRRALNELQRYSISGKIDSGILDNLNDVSILELIQFMKDKDFTKTRHWVSQNLDADPKMLFRSFYDNATQYIKPNCIPILVILIAKYQYQDAFSADSIINTSAFLAECMIEMEWK